jgi:type IV pilus assembly protein PilV
MPIKYSTSIPRPKQNGFTLLEILVAVVVLSIGLLGLAGLQVSSLNNNQIAYYRSIASQQTYDMADRMRSNLAGVTAGNYDNLTTAIPTNPNCMTGGCTVANMTLTDHFQWQTNNAILLPGGAGSVLCINCPLNAANPSRIYDITVTWTEKTPVGNITQSFVTRFAP